MKKSQNGSKGFTLIELLIVIAVIAILAALAIPNLIGSRKAANETSAIATMRTIITSEESYKSRNLGAVQGGAALANGYSTLANLETEKLVQWPTAGSYIKSGFTFTDLADSPTANTWGVYGKRTTANDGDRDFVATNDGFVRSQAAGAAPATTVLAQGLTALQ